jgi:hypothetical protein
MNRSEQEELLINISREYQDDPGEDWGEAIVAAADILEEDTISEASWRPVANLREGSDAEMDQRAVSKVSIFGDNYWDFQHEGSPAYRGTARVNLDKGIDGSRRLTDTSAAPLLRFVKALLYYNLPSKALYVRTRSYNTVPNAANHILAIAKLLCSLGIYMDINGNGAFPTAESLTQDDIRTWLEATENPALKYQVLYQIENWQKLSMEGYMPRTFCVSRELVSTQMLRDVQRAWQESRNQAVGHLPISLDDLGILVPHCIAMIETHAEDILFVHNAVTNSSALLSEEWAQNESEKIFLAMKSRPAPALWLLEDYRDPTGSLNNSSEVALRNSIREYPGWEKNAGVKNLQLFSNAELISAARRVGVDLEEFRGGTVFFNMTALRFHYQGLAVRLRTACEVMILLVTGMRRIELANLKAGRARRVPGSSDEYNLRFEVYKTSDSSSGDPVTLPIPEIAFKAYKVLERVTAAARLAADSDNLYINILHRNYADFRHVNDMARQLVKFSDYLGLVEPIHPHQFRKSLAMFFIYHDPRNLTILKRLFSHKSLAMTLKYIVQIPGMSEEIRKAVIDTHLDLLLDLMDAVNTGRIGGSAGIRFKQSVEKTGFIAKLNDDGYESLRMFVETLLEHETRVLSRCRMAVVCTKMHSSIVDSAPEPCDCDIVNCDNAIFTAQSIGDLKEEIRFHSEVLANKKAGKGQRGYSEKRVADCLARLSEVMGDDVVASEYAEMVLSAA